MYASALKPPYCVSDGPNANCGWNIAAAAVFWVAFFFMTKVFFKCLTYLLQGFSNSNIFDAFHIRRSYLFLYLLLLLSMGLPNLLCVTKRLLAQNLLYIFWDCS